MKGSPGWANSIVTVKRNSPRADINQNGKILSEDILKQFQLERKQTINMVKAVKDTYTMPSPNYKITGRCSEITHIRSNDLSNFNRNEGQMDNFTLSVFFY